MTIGRRLLMAESLVLAWTAAGCHGVCYDTSGAIRWGTVVPIEEWNAYVEAANGDLEKACEAACEAQPGHGEGRSAVLTDCESSSWPAEDTGVPTGQSLYCHGVGAITSPCE